MPRLRLLPPVEEVRDWSGCAPVLQHLMQRGGTIAIDTETTGLRILEDKILFWSMATEDRRWCFPAQLLWAFEPLFARADVSWCMANAKYDLHMLRNAGISIAGRVFDIIVMDAMVDDTRPHGLKDQAWLAYEAKWGEFKELFLDPVIVANTLGLDKKKFVEFKKLNGGDKLLFVYAQASELVTDYASCDAYFTHMLWRDLVDRLASEVLPVEICSGFDTLYDYFNVIEVPMTRTLWNMERRGIYVDLDYVKQIDEPMRNGIASATQELRQMVGTNFNPKSTPDLRNILYGAKFGLKPVMYTKGGKKSAVAGTDEKSLKLLMERGKGSESSKFIFKLLELKKLVKLHGTYVKGIAKHLGPDGRIHTRYNQAGARTSRLSSSDPNMQNLPRVDNDKYKIRGAFIASDGKSLLDGDYPQIEFRVAAVQAGDEKMMDAVRKGWDIHNANTVNMFPGLSYEDVVSAKGKKKEQLTAYDIEILKKRQESKTVGLGTLFGEGPTKMALQLNITRQRAMELKDSFFGAYPAIFDNIMFYHGFAKANGFTFTMLGRMRRLHRIGSPLSSGKIIAQEERQAYNTGIQGSAAELMKLAMLRVDNDPDLKSLGAELLLTVHDELVAEGPHDTKKDCAEIMGRLMGDPLRWGPLSMEYPVPITPEIGHAHRWSEAH